MENRNITEMSFDEIFPPLNGPENNSVVSDEKTASYGSNPLTEDDSVHESYDTDCENHHGKRSDAPLFNSNTLPQPPSPVLNRPVPPFPQQNITQPPVREMGNPVQSANEMYRTPPPQSYNNVQPPVQHYESNLHQSAPSFDSGAPQNGVYFDSKPTDPTSYIHRRKPTITETLQTHPEVSIMIFGMISILFNIMGTGIIFAIIGLVKANRLKKEHEEKGEDNIFRSRMLAGKILCVIGLVFALITLAFPILVNLLPEIILNV